MPLTLTQEPMPNWLESRKEYVRRDLYNFDNLTQTPIITITGERQTGKTTMILSRMITHAQEGLRVLYLAPTVAQANHLHNLDWRQFEGLVKVRHSAGKAGADFGSKGSIEFRSINQSGRGGRYDVIVFDDVDPKPVWLLQARGLIYVISN